ncbi:hypothetical protein RCS94_06270 [Orbaceae bacterium ac157xtp]
MLIAPNSYGALSATSANTIKGNAPTFMGQSGASKLGFKIGTTMYSEREGNLSSSSSVINYFNAGLKLSDFMVISLAATDFSPTTDFYDADGDEGFSTATDTFLMGSVTYDWYEGNTRLDKTNATVMNKTLDCGSGLNLPLTLKITLPNVKVRSRYGDPNESGETDLVKTYKIGSTSGICYVKPNNLETASSDPLHGGGYTDDFEPSKGFKASADPKFPTTGFPGAEFKLIMTSSNSNWEFSSNTTAVKVSNSYGKEGAVTLKSKPTGAVTIKAKLKGSTNPVIEHEYTFNPSNVWVVPRTSQYTYAQAINVCGGENKIPTRADLTNSPYSTGYEGVSSIPYNYFTRAIGGGVMGEWGAVKTGGVGAYPGESHWHNSWFWYWTRDVYDSNYHFYVMSGLQRGGVGWLGNGDLRYVACLG